LVLRELQGVGRKAGLAPFEIIEGVVLTDGEWSSMNVSSESKENGRREEKYGANGDDRVCLHQLRSWRGGRLCLFIKLRLMRFMGRQNSAVKLILRCTIREAFRSVNSWGICTIDRTLDTNIAIHEVNDSSVTSFNEWVKK
jgi:hypothetical protein